ncbi:3-hydroxyacyl-CoA dehydrogenase [Rubrobacter xylanophilus]|uniref:3-hydroxyacyl-CoA dehydrogenase n=1 Tax=Rubrobacter xylanophilus TaxID=49319 RepID=A0A510HLJ4_9ACTN|nr:3-hydroxyacyl-CoA dehydrogenase [Rubrobacter xylanophilus]BBL80901.1 3-hydroxyacyl-CoA dehydrogenase [Rubrobacter xylanophilus]
MEISGKTFIVTGGGSGLGAATVRMLAGEGANVLIADIDRERAETLAGELGSSVRFARADVADEKGMRAALEEARSAFGGPHGLVNCAGIGTAARVVGKKGVHPLELFERTIRVNLVGTFNAIRLAAALMMENEPSDEDGERGVIVNTASVAAFDGQIGQAAYSASKGGVVAMTLPIARELASSGIRVATIAPGIFETPMLGELPEEVRRSLGEQIPFPRRLGRPGEYASLVRHIVENRMINGEVIRLDGAIRMAPR